MMPYATQNGGSVRVAGDRDDYATRQKLSRLSNPILPNRCLQNTPRLAW